VKFWGVGNENWGCGGDMAADYYANIYRNYASYIKGKDFQRVICGPSEGDVEWTETILKGLRNKMHLTEAVSMHYYTIPTGDWGQKGSSIDFGEELWFETLRRTMHVEDYIQRHLRVMDKYDPEGKVKLIVDEWGTWYDKLPGTKEGFLQQQNTLRDALVAGINLNIFNKHADRISMANIAQIVNVLQSVIMTKGAMMIKTPTYYVFQMYKVHQGATLIPIKLETETYDFMGKSIPALTASASEKDGVTNITITNSDPNKAQVLKVDLGRDTKAVTGKIVNASQISDYNDFGVEEKVTIRDFEISASDRGNLEFDVPAHSVVLIQINK